jgi:hypothetical protein
MLEAGVRQFREWGNCDQGRHHPYCCRAVFGRPLSNPARAVADADIASRLTRGGELHREML